LSTTNLELTQYLVYFFFPDKPSKHRKLAQRYTSYPVLGRLPPHGLCAEGNLPMARRVTPGKSVDGGTRQPRSVQLSAVDDIPELLRKRNILGIADRTAVRHAGLSDAGHVLIRCRKTGLHITGRADKRCNTVFFADNEAADGGMPDFGITSKILFYSLAAVKQSTYSDLKCTLYVESYFVFGILFEQFVYTFIS